MMPTRSIFYSLLLALAACLAEGHTQASTPVKGPLADWKAPRAVTKAHGCRSGQLCAGRVRFFPRLRCLLRGAAAECGQAASDGWRPLFDGRSLAGWNESDFLRAGPVRVEEGSVRIETGQPLTGITWTGEFPTSDYEIRLEAMRVEGGDFFCGLTFPVDESHCTLVLGGWGGSTVGISSIDSYDASENETTRYIDFEQGRWYAIRLRVTEGRITAWIDDAEDPLIDVDVAERRLTTRWEVDPSKPLGIASYQTTAALRNLEYRRLPASR